MLGTLLYFDRWAHTSACAPAYSQFVLLLMHTVCCVLLGWGHLGKWALYWTAGDRQPGRCCSCCLLLCAALSAWPLPPLPTPPQVYALGRSFTAASWLWYVSFEWGVFELRGVLQLYKLAKAAWSDAKALVMNPQAIAVAPQVAAEPGACMSCMLAATALTTYQSGHYRGGVLPAECMNRLDVHAAGRGSH